MSGKKFGSIVAVVAILVVALALAWWGAAAATTASDLRVSIREWDVPTKGAHPHDPAVGKNGELWFTEQMTNKIGRFDPASQSFKEYPLTGGNAGPHGLVADADGNIWFTANFGGYIGKLDLQLATSLNTQCQSRKRTIRTLRFSIAAALYGLPCRAETWSGASIPRPGK